MAARTAQYPRHDGARSATVLAPSFERIAAELESETRNIFGRYVVTVSPPVTSGADGRALRELRLSPKTGGPFVVVGLMDSSGRCAELRSLGYVLALSKQVFGKELSLPPREYARFSTLAKALLERNAVAVRTQRLSGNANGDARAPARSSRVHTLPYLEAIGGRR